MDWWNNITPGQGTIIGGLFVVTAGFLAFSTGWFERRAAQRRFHYEEMRDIYSNVLRLAEELANLPMILRGTETEQFEIVGKNSEKVSAALGDLDLTGDYETAQMLSTYLYQELLHGMASVNARGATDKPDGHITDEVLMKQVRKSLSKYLPRTSFQARSLRKPLSDTWKRRRRDLAKAFGDVLDS